MRIFSLQIPKL